jgi:tetrameric-type glycyl-tRNA synthetase beta subunit
LPTLLLEIGCEELPAWACREAEAQLPGLVRAQLAAEPSAVLVGPRRLVVIVEDLPDATAPQWVKGPPAAAPARARVGFARRHGLDPAALEERDGVLGFERPGEELAAVLPSRLAALVGGLAFGKSMTWTAGGLRFARPVRWLLGKLGPETIAVEVGDLRGGSVTHGHRFTHDEEIEVPEAAAYLELLRAAAVEPDQSERRRAIVEALDGIGGWSDPAGKLDEVVHMAERPVVLEGAFNRRYLQLPERVIETAMQSHQRYFPLGGNRFAIVVDGGDPAVVRAGHENVLENRLEDASFTFERDLARGIDALAGSLARITFFTGAGSYAEKADRLAQLVARLGGGEAAREAARLAKADQAAELVREFPDLEGYIGAEYARLAGYPEAVCKAVEEHHLPDASAGPLPSTEAGKVVAAADKLDTLAVAFSLGHRPTGSRDPYGLRRAAIGLCRLALEGGLVVERAFMPDEVRDFVEERLEGLLDVPVEMVRAARASAASDLAGVARLAEALAGLEDMRLDAVHEVFTRAQRIAGQAEPGPWRAELLAEDGERELASALDEARPALAGGDLDAAFSAAAGLAPPVERFFDEVLVMADDPAVRENRLRLLLDLRDTVGALGDFSQIPR